MARYDWTGMSAMLDKLSDQQLAQLATSHAPPPSAPASQPAPAAKPVHQQSDGELLNMLANANPNMSTAEDVGRSAITGLERGATAIAGLPHQVDQARDWLVQHGVQGAADLAGIPMTPQQRQTISSVFGATPVGTIAGGGMHPAPSTAALDAMVQRHAGPYHDPQSMAGRFAEAIGEQAPNALIPGGTAARIGRVVLPAAAGQGASEVAGAAGVDPKYQGAIQFGGTVLGGGLEGGLEHIGAAPEAAFSRSMGPNTMPAQLRAAQALRDSSPVSLTLPEAIQQAMGGSTDLGNLQRILESTARTRPGMQAFFAQRPGQVSTAVNNFTDPLLAGAPDHPGLLASQAQDTAQGTLDTTRQAINAQAQPYYDALRNQDMPTFHAALMQDPSYERALATIRNDPELNGGISGLPDSNLAVTNEIVKQLQTGAEGARQTALNPGGNNYVASLRGTAADRADTLASLVSPEWQAARSTVANGRTALLDPLEAGPVGGIARSGDLGGQTSALYPDQPFRGQPTATGDAITAMNSQDPNTGRWLTGQHIANTFDQASANLQSGPNQYGGARFARQLVGNPTQADTLQAGLDAVDPSGGTSGRMNALVDALQATGQRMQPGSRTAFNAQEINPASAAPSAIKFLGGLGDPLEWTKLLSNATGGALYRRNLDEMSRLMLDPDTAASLQRILAAPNATTPAQYLLPGAIQGDQSQ